MGATVLCQIGGLISLLTKRINGMRHFAASVFRGDKHERDRAREARAMGAVVWDVIQNGELVGIFPSQDEADAYRRSLEEAQPQG
jgi:hypothetical protein